MIIKGSRVRVINGFNRDVEGEGIIQEVFGDIDEEMAPEYTIKYDNGSFQDIDTIDFIIEELDEFE
jgi:hypothetical protein